MEEADKNQKLESISIPMLEEFIRHISLERNLSSHTIRNYFSDLSQFYEYLTGVLKKDTLLIEDLRNIDHIILRAFLANLYEKGL
ncbi:MAG: site-specific integrase, partial [Nitrospirota bacterium]